jgi:hypothetical protein
MKKIYLSLSVVLAGTVAMAQSVSRLELTSAIGKEIAPIEHSVALDATDTLGLDDFGSQIFQYGSPSGYVFGVNALDGTVQGQPITQINVEYAAGFLANTEYNVIGAMMWFGGKADVSGNPADLKVKMYSLADDQAVSSATVQQPDVIGPDQMLASVNLPFADVDTASFNTPTYALFSSHVWTGGDFALAVDISDLYGTPADTVWLYASEDGASDGSYTWTNLDAIFMGQQIPGGWALTTGLLQGGLDVNLGIFAMVDESGVGIEEQGFLNGVKMTTYPNPAVSSDVVRIQYGLENPAEKVEINVFDMNGKLMFSQVEGDRAAGIHTVVVPAGTLSAGSYVYSLEANGGRMAKQLQILK